ncbi:hypothetical protein [Paracoccus zhejiangensis]|uniref:hypothetical protein n=1 Tax=Paracoccus zhejiangensis TaxID=1077935 RepID=UPI0013001197|nr:hypothetical protein [Paracoccus zhejiangensis]
MREFRPLLLAAAAVTCGFGAAEAQESASPATGLCGQPAALTAQSLSFDKQPEDVTGAFVQLRRNEPRYIELGITAPVALTMLADSGSVDTTLILFGDKGQIVASDDDGGGDTNARIVSRLQPGNYCLQVDTVVNFAETDAVVPVSITPAPPPDACIRTAGEPVEIKAGSDEIITSDQLSAKASIALNVAAGTGVRIEARSPIFDTYLTLEDGIGQVISEDDDGGGDTNSKLELAPVSTDGSYCVNLTSLDESGGIYALSIIPITETSVPAASE